MCHVHLLHAVDRSMRDLLNSDEPFGGVPIVVGGDFRQQAPVVLRGNRVKVVEACVKSSHLWPKFTNLCLTLNMRVRAAETAFSDWLLSVGSGVQEGMGEFISIDEDLLTEDVVDSIFGSNIHDLSPEDLAGRAILCPKNRDTLIVNNTILSKLPGDTTTYFR